MTILLEIQRRIPILRLEFQTKAATIGGKSFIIQLNTTKMATACKHPKVRIVSRHEDTEFVECLECGEVFDSEEFNDMVIEETVDQAKDSTADEE
jgi:hypothetical protein